MISYVKKYQGHGLDLSELVAIGNEGLLKAVQKFDPDQGVKFISYAVWWVRQAVLKALAEQTRRSASRSTRTRSSIRLPRAETLPRAGAGARADRRRDRRLPRGRRLDSIRAATPMTATEVSLDAPVDRSGPRGVARFGERFAGVDGSEIEDMTDYKLMREFIDRIFQKYLTPRERKILSLYYGLDEGSEALTLEKIGALLGVTRERIRQIRERAFEKLRDSPDVRPLRGSGERRRARLSAVGYWLRESVGPPCIAHGGPFCTRQPTADISQQPLSSTHAPHDRRDDRGTRPDRRPPVGAPPARRAHHLRDGRPARPVNPFRAWW